MRKDRSLGEMISTVVFFGVATYLLIDGLGLFGEGQKWRGIGSLFAATCCALGGLRFAIANFVAMWRKS